MGYMNEFPHSRMFDSDLREILEKYFELKDLPVEWEKFKIEINKYIESVSYDVLLELEKQGKLVSPVVNVKLYGASGDGNTDDTAAISRAINENPIGIFYFPKGNYIIKAPITLGNGQNILGADPFTSVITAKIENSTANAISLTGVYSWIKNIALHGNEKCGGLSIEAGQCRVDNLRIFDFRTNIRLFGTVGSTISNCYLTSAVNYEIFIASPNAPDAGDNTITGCVLDTSRSTDCGIYQQSSGGLRLLNNKILHHYICYKYESVANSETSVLVIDGNSFENPMNWLLQIIAKQSPFGKIVISNNEFEGGSDAPEGILLTNVYDVVIEGNVIRGSGSRGIAIDGTTKDVMIANNIIANFRYPVHSDDESSGISIIDNQIKSEYEYYMENTIGVERALVYKPAYDISYVDTTGDKLLFGCTLPVNSSVILELNINGYAEGVGIINFVERYKILNNGTTHVIEGIDYNNYGTATINTFSVASAEGIELYMRSGDTITVHANINIIGVCNRIYKGGY